MTSILKDSLKFVFPTGSRRIVWYVHSTLDNSSTQSLFYFSNLVLKSHNMSDLLLLPIHLIEGEEQKWSVFYMINCKLSFEVVAVKLSAIVGNTDH